MVRNSAKANEKRDEFYCLAAEMPINKALNQVAPITIKDYAIEKAKKFLYSTGTIKYIRKLKKKHTIKNTRQNSLRKYNEFLNVRTQAKAAFLFSLTIEFLQLFLRLGTFQLSDLCYNTLGGAVGGVLYWMGWKVKKQ